VPEPLESEGLIPEREEADAVCERCGGSNDEGAAVCPHCGNNLVAQRTRRFADPEYLKTFERRRPRWLPIGLTVLAILIVIWAAINVDSWLASRRPSPEDPRRFWSAHERDVYEPLRDELERHRLTRVAIGRAQAEAAGGTLFDGRYVLTRGNTRHAVVIGQAQLERSGDTVHFVAQLTTGEEIRGEAYLDYDNEFVAPIVGVKTTEGIFRAAGRTGVNDDGGFWYIGWLEGDDEPMRGVAYLIPES